MVDEEFEILVRVVPKPDVDEGYVDLGGPDAFVERFSDRAADIGRAIQTITGQIQSQLQTIVKHATSDWKVDELSLTVSFDLEAEAGVVIAKTKATAGFEVAITWHHDPTPGD